MLGRTRTVRSRRAWLSLTTLMAMSGGCAQCIGADWDEYSRGEPELAGSGGSTSGSGSGGAGEIEGIGGKICTPRTMAVCYDGPPDTIDRGVCRAGMKTCNEEGTGYGPCVGQVLPGPELCHTAEDEDCAETETAVCVYRKCGDVPKGSPSGAYLIDLDGPGPNPIFEIYCDMDTDGGGWALVYNSIGSDAGTTLAFWSIPYAERFSAKGVPARDENFYFGSLYLYGKEYRDEVEDLFGASVEVMRARADGIDRESMAFVEPMLVSGSSLVFDRQFQAGWSSIDFDGDAFDGNCASVYGGVTQHYASCWVYNLGADDDMPREDSGWGPHISLQVAKAFGLGGDGTVVSRVKRISRWTRW